MNDTIELRASDKSQLLSFARTAVSRSSDQPTVLAAYDQLERFVAERCTSRDELLLMLSAMSQQSEDVDWRHSWTVQEFEERSLAYFRRMCL